MHACMQAGAAGTAPLLRVLARLGALTRVLIAALPSAT